MVIRVASGYLKKKFKDSASIYSRRHKRMYPMTAALFCSCLEPDT